MNRLQIIITAVSIIVAIIGVILFGMSGRPQDPGSTVTNVPLLKVWGTEKTAVLAPAFKKYEGEKKTKIEYTEIDQQAFGTIILEALASGTGPDAIITDIDWIQENRDKLADSNPSFVSIADLKTSYVDIIGQTIIFSKTDTKTKKTVEYTKAIPLWIDPLVLFWDKDIFNGENIALPPANWDEFTTISQRISKTDTTGNVERAGAAMGRAYNIPRYKEIVSLLILQQGAKQQDGFFTLENIQQHRIESALRYYTDFARPSFKGYTWNAALPEPITLFSAGKLGMMIDYMSAADDIRRRNPHIAFAIAKIPQPKDAEVPIYTADIIGLTVPIVAKYQAAAWAFGAWLSSMDTARELVMNKSVTPARRDLLRDSKVASKDWFPIMKESALNTRRLSDQYATESSTIIANMIESIVGGRSTISEAINEGSKRMDRIIKSTNQ
jgi:ABC-type glycerol-3-phosphate transport system substrate-binding protein